jgi:hypothetical protein
MPDVELIATQDFSYSTRRLKAGDSFTVPARMARVLVGIGKAEEPRQAGRVGAPPARVLDRAMTATGKPAPRPVGAISTRTAGTKPAGKATTRKRRTPRKSTAEKG